MVTAGRLFELYSLRLDMNRKGVTQWSPSLRVAVEGFVEKLKPLDPDEKVEIEADLGRNPIAKFIRTATGEVLGEIDTPPEDEIIQRISN